MANAYEIATWRLHQILPLLDETLDCAARRRAIRERTRRAVPWPDGKKKRIGRSTLHRWLQAYRKDGYSGLFPKRRADADPSRIESASWIDYAIGLLYEQHDRSLHQLTVYLQIRFPDYALSRSSLSRHLHKHPAYSGVEKLRSGKAKKLHRRFEAGHPHESWQLDGKGDFTAGVRGRRVSGSEGPEAGGPLRRRAQAGAGEEMRHMNWLCSDKTTRSLRNPLVFLDLRWTAAPGPIPPFSTLHRKPPTP